MSSGDDPPHTLKMRASRRYLGYLVLIGSALTAAAGTDTWLVAKDGLSLAVAWIGLVFFGSGSLLFVYCLVVRPTLMLDAQGFAYKGPLHARRFQWGDVSPFVVAPLPRPRSRVLPNDGVYFDLTQPPASRFGAWLRRANRAVAGHERMLPDRYGVTSEELAGTLNAWRDRSRGAGSPGLI